MAERCRYPQCTSTIADAEKAITVTGVPEAEAQRFCSLTCAWSWLQSHVGAKAPPIPPRMEALDPPVAMPRLTTKKAPASMPEEVLMPSHPWPRVPVNAKQHLSQHIQRLVAEMNTALREADAVGLDVQVLTKTDRAVSRMPMMVITGGMAGEGHAP